MRANQYSVFGIRYSILLIPLLWLAFALLLGSAVQKSPTVDEQSHLFRGAAYLKANAKHFLLGHPIGNSALAAIPLLIEPSVNLPTEIPAWADGNWSTAGDYFMWRVNENPQRMIVLGRIPIIFCSLVLGCLIFRWGKQLGGAFVGLLAATLILFDPTVLAHGNIIAGDNTLTLWWALTIYGFWRWSQHGKYSAILLSGFGLGMASLTKFNAAFLLPTLVLLALIEWWRRRDRAPFIALTGSVFVGGVVIWAVNGFSFTPLPGGAFWDDLFWQAEYFGRNTGGYLLGNYDPNGSPLFFPLAYALKTPLPTLLVVLFGLVFGIRYSVFSARRTEYRILNTEYLLLPALIFLAAALSAGFNIGIRHLLPLYPFLYLFVALGWQSLAKTHLQTVAAVGVAFSIFVAIWAFPNYLSFFNQTVGGSDNGWRYLADSNVDWGQDLPALATWQRENGDKPLFLSYFGTAHASAYDFEYEPIPAPIIVPDQPPPNRQMHDPRHPRAGYYAISANNLIGFPMPQDQRDIYAAFRDMEPVTTINGSILIYEIEPTGERVDVALSGIRPNDLPNSIYELFSTNDLRIRWFDDATQRLIIPEGRQPFILTDSEIPSIFSQRANLQRLDTIDGVNIYTLPAPPQFQREPVVGEGIQHLGSYLYEGETVTVWQATEKLDQPLKHFVHLTHQGGALVDQRDADALQPFATLYENDLYLHRSGNVYSLEPQGTGRFNITIGLYDAATGTRLIEPISIGGVQVFE